MYNEYPSYRSHDYTNYFTPPDRTSFSGNAAYSLSDQDLRAVVNLGTDSSMDTLLREYLNNAVARVNRQIGRNVAPGDRTDYYPHFNQRLTLTEVPAGDITLRWKAEDNDGSFVIPIANSRPATGADWVYDDTDCDAAIAWVPDDTNYPDLWDLPENPVSATYHVSGDLTNPTISSAIRSLVFLQYTERGGVENVEAGRIIARVERELRQLRDILV